MSAPARTLSIIGATGGTGRALVRRALYAGHRVRVLVRDRQRVDAPDDATESRLEIATGDVLDVPTVRRAVAGCDAVLCALGAPARSPSRIRSEGTRAIVEAMAAERVHRVIAVSVFGVGDTWNQLPLLLRRVYFPLVLSRVVEEHARQEQLLSGSGLEWTAVRAPELVDRDSPLAVSHGETLPAGAVHACSREELAAFMLDELEARRYVRRAPAITRVREAPAAWTVAVPNGVVSAGVAAAVALVAPLPGSTGSFCAAQAVTGLVSGMIGAAVAVRAVRRAAPVRDRPRGA